jgi:DNA-directed RNA polymerase subunit alpha
LINIVLPTVKKIVAQGNYGSYEIGPISELLAHPFANSLRRVLLSSLEGAAITSVCIEGVQHEYRDIVNVKEDVPEIVQNLKKIRLLSFSDHAVTMRLDAKGVRIVLARDICAPGTIEIVTPCAHIATLDNMHTRLSMEMTVNIGRGFVAFDTQNVRELPIGVIPIDAIYSPVRHVKFTIEHMCAGQLTNFSKIILEITTDETISPDEALREASGILIQQFSVFQRWQRPQVPATRLSKVPIPPSVYNLSLKEIGLHPRIINLLKRKGITKIGQILEKERHDLLSLKNMGEKSLRDIVAKVVETQHLLPESEC